MSRAIVQTVVPHPPLPRVELHTDTSTLVGVVAARSDPTRSEVELQMPGGRMMLIRVSDLSDFCGQVIALAYRDESPST